jgi:hypothetical protein
VADPNYAVSGEPVQDRQYRYAPQSTEPVRNIPATNPVTIRQASYAPPQSATTSRTINSAQYAMPANSMPRPEVQRAVAALRGMPPTAREQQLARYTNLSPADVEQVRAMVGLPALQ